MTKQQADVIIFAHKTLGQIEGPLFGQFIELVGRCINNGLYDPLSPHARLDGVRADVVDALRELRPTHIRYPGGCATAYFDWQELVGPPKQRPRAKLFRNTRVPQSTAFGIPEAWELCRELGAELYLTVNAHTQSPEDAANLVEYLNGTQKTKWADLRRAHGREEPFGVKLFGLGNEIYGDWQPGQKTAEEYGRWCSEAIRQMKNADPGIQVVVCGTGRPDPAWDRNILQSTQGQADMIAVHNYFGRPLFRDNMAASLVFAEMIEQLNGNINEVMDANLHNKNRPGIALDEWNVWYRTGHDPKADVEEIYNFTDALTVASLLHVVLRNTRTVHLSNISLLGNTLGCLFTDRERCVRQTIFYPQLMLHNGHGGRVVETIVDCATFSAKHERFFNGIVDAEKARDETLPSLLHFDAVPALDVLVSVDEERRKTTVSVVQKQEHEAVEMRLDWRGIVPQGKTVRVHQLRCDDLLAENTLDVPDRVVPFLSEQSFSDTWFLPPASFTVLEFEL